MCRTIIYEAPVELNGGAIECGQGVRVVFESLYNEENDHSGEEFGDNDFEYVTRLGNDWQKGHILAKRFGGDNRSHNLLPMTQAANLYFKTEVEDKLSQILFRLYWMDNCYQMASNFARIKIVYKVFISDTIINMNGIEIPEYFTAQIDVESGSDVNYNVVNNLIRNIDIDIRLPFERRIRTNRN